MGELLTRVCWCGADAATSAGTFHLESGEKFDLVQCAGCGVRAIHPQPSEGVLVSHYSREYYGAARQKFIWPLSVIVGWLQSARARTIARAVPPPGRILDIGCGNGGFLVQMKRRGYAVEGTEWTSQSATRIRAGAGLTIHVGDLLGLDLPLKSYDLITLWHVLEHLRQPDEALKQVRRLLKPGGAVIIAVPNVDSPQATRFGLDWLHYDPPRHLFNFGGSSLRTLLNHSGFEIQSCSTWSFEQNTFGYLQSWLNARGIPRDRLYALLKGISLQRKRTKAIDLCWFGLLALPAMVISMVQAMRGRGATMTILARPVP